MSQLSDLLVQFRKSLHDALDSAFDRGSQDFLLKIIAENNTRFESIQQALQRITSTPPQTIPELYNVNMNLADAVHECSKAPNPTMELDEESVIPDNEESVIPDNEECVIPDNISDAEEPDVAYEESVISEEPDVEHAASIVADEESVVPDNDDADDEMTESVSEEEALQELEVDGTTYYYDSAGNVYTLSEDGTPSEEPVGTYNTESGEFELFESEAMEEITYKNKKYYKDSQDNVYNADMEPLPYTYTNNRFVRKA
jgi:hypothetical protein